MASKIFCALAMLAPLAVCAPAIAQQPAGSAPQVYPPPQQAGMSPASQVVAPPPAVAPPPVNAPQPNYPPPPPVAAPAAAPAPNYAPAPAQPPQPGALPAAPAYAPSAPAPNYPQPPPAGTPPPVSGAPTQGNYQVPLNSPEQPRSVGDQSVPYHVHHDTRHGHDHVYPDRGSVVREVPRGALAINYAGLSYRFHEGVWFEPRGPAYIVVAPPIGLMTATLPAFATTVASGGEAYLYANDVFYRARPDIGGYEVVNDPADSEPAAAAATAAAPAPNAQALPVAAPPPNVPVASVPVVSVPAASVPVGSVPVASVPVANASAPLAPVPVANATLPGPATVNALPAAATPAVVAAAPAPAVTAAASSTYAYPRNGQTPEQQARDHYDCYRFAVAQTGFDPLRPYSGTSSSQGADRQGNFARAQSACYEGRGYTLR